MATDLYFCIYNGTGTNKQTTTKSQVTNEPGAVVYQSFLQGLSNDIQRYQALQRVICGHSACKEALLKTMQGARAG